MATVKPNWRFSRDDPNGSAWFANPKGVFAHVEYCAKDGAWRRLMVATRSWLDQQLQLFGSGAEEARWSAFPALVVIGDGSADEIRGTLDAVVSNAAIDMYSVPITAVEDDSW